MKPLATTFTLFAALAVFFCTIAVQSGCETTRSNNATIEQPEFSIRSSANKIMAGETVTFTTRSTNLAGRRSEIAWSSTGGELSTDHNNQVARVHFDRPGTYMVTAKLNVDGKLAETDTATIKVIPIEESSR